jgi:DNA helicase-2/ATP-dependent DNA helicase PcrA
MNFTIEEARWIGEEIEALARGTRGLAPVSPDGIAILVRASHQMRAFEDRFLTIGLPYRVIGGPRFYERQEIRDAMAYFRVAVSPDDDLAFERIVNVPKRGLGDKAVQEINRVARANGLSLLEGARRLTEQGGLPPRARGALSELVTGFDIWHAQIRDNAPHVELAEQILDESGYTAMWRAEKTPDAAGRLDNLKELVKALNEFDNLQGFLEHVALVMDNEGEDEAAKVSVMTLHAAKGLEFPAVFLPGWEDGLFPSQRAMDESGIKGVEEERRLAYVGITRAREQARISFAANRQVYGRWTSQLPSRFVDELPIGHVEASSETGYYGGGPGMQQTASRWDDSSSFGQGYSSPGWKRAQAKGSQFGGGGHRQPVIEGDGRLVVNAGVSSSAFARGDRVFHQKFGYGAVKSIEGNKLTVAFDKAGEKKVIDSFVEKA